MNKIKTGLLALALVGSGAFGYATMKQKEANSTVLAPFVWYPTVSTTNSAPDFSKPSYPSRQAAIDALGCEEGSLFCAREVDQATNTPTANILNKN